MRKSRFTEAQRISSSGKQDTEAVCEKRPHLLERAMGGDERQIPGGPCGSDRGRL